LVDLEFPFIIFLWNIQAFTHGNLERASFFKYGMDEINIADSQYYNAQDEKKDFQRSKTYMNERQMKL